MNSVSVVATNAFEKSIKKIPKSSKLIIDSSVKKLIENPTIGQLKKGDLQHIRVYKFKLNNQLTLLAYSFKDNQITLLLLGTHENFYKNLKNKMS